jgi:hypothetical protein
MHQRRAYRITPCTDEDSMSKYHLLTFAALAGLAGGCSADPVDPAEPSFFRASIDGGIEYEGSADFNTGTPGPKRRQFSISSYQAGQGHSFAVTRWDGGRLGIGLYPLALVNVDAVAPTGLSLQYFSRTGALEDQYIAESGELEITESSASRVAGRFTITAVRYCRYDMASRQSEGPCTLTTISPGKAPRITVIGTFSATPLKTSLDVDSGTWR